MAITTAGKAEILRLLLPVPQVVGDDQWLSWGLSLGYSLLYGMQHYFMLGTNEIDFELEGPWLHSDLGRRYNMLSLAFVDPSLGGSGYLRRVADEFHLVARRTIEHLDHPDCETACYRCLKSYQNQRFHDSLRWPQVMDALEELAQIVPKSRPLETGDMEDPGPWLEAYEAGVGSPLELKFLRLFEQHGFNPQKQVPVGPSDSESPISVADFAVPRKTSRDLHRWGRLPHRGTISTRPLHPSSVERGQPAMDGRGIKSDGLGARGSTCGTIERSLSGSRQGARALQPLAIRQACLVPLALSAPSHERMVHGPSGGG